MIFRFCHPETPKKGKVLLRLRTWCGRGEKCQRYPEPDQSCAGPVVTTDPGTSLAGGIHCRRKGWYPTYEGLPKMSSGKLKQIIILRLSDVHRKRDKGCDAGEETPIFLSARFLQMSENYRALVARGQNQVHILHSSFSRSRWKSSGILRK